LKKIFRYLDRAQEDLAEVTQRFNKATGMDYSGITALRAKIQDQEKQIQYHHATILKAKNAVEAADTQRAAAQKEVVGLLERKHSWTSGDLERYMSLIRSEHVNDQAVSESKEKLRAAETALELARSKMEQMVASQYHEETLLNDTIRRNSTWVTVGLMGFNVFLLLASLVIIEPWRRKRLVREIRTAFDEQNLLAQPHLAAATSITAETPQITDSAAVTDGALGSSSIPPVTPLTAFTEEPVDTEETNPHNHLDRLNHWMSIVRDRFSDRQVTMKQLDITSIALQGASAGAAVAIGLMILLNPR
jgi:sensitive to high expression protein 9